METKNSFNATDNFYILPPQDLLLKIDELNEIFNNTNHIFFNSSNALKIQGEDIKITLAMDKILILKKSIGNIYDVLIAYFKEYLNYKIIVFYNREEFRDRLLNKIKLTNDVNIDNIFFIKSNAINNGFIFKDCIFLNEEEVTGVKQTFIKEKKHNNILNTLGTFNISDILVHKKHGFGIYQGLKTLRVNNIDHDFLEIQYKDNEKLYLPVENMDLLSRYSSFSEEVVLDKLGSYAFENKQKKIKEKIKDIAYDLIKLSANRKLKESVVLDFDAQDYENFCNDFPYIETQDQLNAIGDILQDFSLNSPTDRLICGDVGFGKTEVAMRAAFLIANSGYQVIVVTPTTLLCNQHYINFKERFKNVPVKISQLSRFVTNTQKKQIKEDLANGSIDILISTHGVLAKDVKLKKLGLIIVDEEQNFGVVHKEKLKILDEKAHLLTLSATPIPRTIQQAFKGIKELSLINTPPINKLSINTYILPFDLLSIKLAIDKELQRDGQVFIVCPRIKDIQEIQTDLYKVYNNKIKLVIAHGQMPTKNLEDAMIDFQNKKYDVMISTSIIESGLDLKNVNTIIINNSDMFGLAQLYQIRGRVGRSNIQSYAYLLYKNQKSLTPNAEKRLNILQNLDYLGASFALASYDLEIRGAGNLLGEEQSGHIKDIGYDLYQKLLEEELNHIKNNSSTQNEYAFFSPSININAPVLIPKNYISDMEASIQMYQKLSQINDIKQIEDVKNEMIDRFGVLPKQVINLFETIELKILSQKALVDKITFGNRGILYEFYNKTFPKVDELLNYITSSNDGLILKPNGMVLPINEDDEEYDKIKKCKNVLYNLHKILYN